MPRPVHHPHAPAPDLGQDVVVSDLPGGGENHRHGFRVFCTRGGRGFARLAQGANRRAALGRGDNHLFRVGRGLLEPRQQPIVAGQLIYAAATRRTLAEVGGDVVKLRLGELAQGQRTERIVVRMVQWGLGNDKPVWVHRVAKRQRHSLVKKRKRTQNLT